jgi:hypothetical protein
MSEIIYATKTARDKFWAYVLNMKEEVGGFGFVTIDDQGRLVWHETFLVDQDVSGSSVDFTDTGIAQAIEYAAERGVLDDPDFIWLWWHSHNTMATYWSSTDEGGIGALRQSGVPYMISIVGNHRLEHKLRIDVFNVPLIGHATFDDVKLAAHPDEDWAQEIALDLAQFVRVKPNPPKKPGSGTAKTGGTVSATRKDDPGDKVQKVIEQKATGYAEYTQEELSGGYPHGNSYDRQAWADDEVMGLGDTNLEVDDDGLVINWDLMLCPVEDHTNTDWESMGFQIIHVKGEAWLAELPEAQVVKS